MSVRDFNENVPETAAAPAADMDVENVRFIVNCLKDFFSNTFLFLFLGRG